MTLTTTEELKHLASSDNTNELTRRLARECLANREAQPVALVDRRPAARGGICWQHGSKDLPHGTELFTAPPAPANAQAVAWEMRYWNSGHNCWHDWERITAEQHAEMSAEHAADNDYEFRVLYAAPPAPAVQECFLNAVAALESLYRNGQKQNWNERYTADMAYASGVLNACRAAMLAAAQEGGN
ncbi:Uncharacterised protein [Serratia marcescens]|uniref:hypothetical protein n=1 Tax=Serratia marcescens TaxID=615 RepID=UPI00074543BE|nr:hypothetical protein [Serratia marcescens]CUZ08782.1 Uncharacterised protein [Serratia marcescens]CUZ34240.1 Uncharacterised protein [Serratia marcescens]CUZ34733.1 Uncharacterised protein [Serratia marcescens]CUZ36377.1 Uncharacterised protein [Serratia marcescens]CVA05151.1 Uncharacterised protein [Serratia marcescens]